MEKKRIDIPNYKIYSRERKNDVEGKTIEHISYLSDDGECYVVMTFTDGTYSILNSYYVSEDGEIDTFNIPAPTSPSIDKICSYDSAYYTVDYNGNFKYTELGQMLHDFGLYDANDDVVRELIRQKEELKNKYEYERYLRLKEKFENKSGE